MPGFRSMIRYCPVPSVMADFVFSISAGLLASTATPVPDPTPAPSPTPAAKSLEGAFDYNHMEAFLCTVTPMVRQFDCLATSSEATTTAPRAPLANATSAAARTNSGGRST